MVSEHRSRVRYTFGSRWGEIVGHWINERSLCVSQHGLIASRGSLSLVVWSLTNTCGFWSHDNHDSQHKSSKDDNEKPFDEERTNDFMLIAIETQDEWQDNYELDEEEHVVHLQGEIAHALDEIHRLRKKKINR